jgi:hypothetical protein
MRRLLLVVTVMAVMVAMLVVTAMPAFAAPPRQQVTCGTPAHQDQIVSTDPHEFGLLGRFQGESKSNGLDCARDIDQNTGPPS